MAKTPTLISLAKKLLLLLLNVSFLFILVLSLRFKFQYLRPSVPNFAVNPDACASLHDHADKCSYVESNPTCKPKGYINYLHIFYCSFGGSHPLGHALLLLWLLILFYLLGNTAAEYFCPSLESLSATLKLSPTIAGVTLLSLGNGAPDVFASIISFTRSDDADVGLNSALGGAFFVSSVVVGVISFAMSFKDDAISSCSLDRTGFVRDIAFFLFSLWSLIVILLLGRVSLGGAIAFFSIYILYVCSVSATHFFYRSGESTASLPLISYVDDQWHSQNSRCNPVDDDEKLDTSPNETTCGGNDFNRAKLFGKLVFRLLELPLYLPRRATIPMVMDEKWSKTYAVASVTLAPILIAFLSNTQRANVDSRAEIVTYMMAVLVGMVLGNLAYVTTSPLEPPRQCLFPWLVAGFLMSVTWTYIVAEEMVSLLVTLGHVFCVSPSVLGLTILAWGNSLGDLIANVAVAVRGGRYGPQIALSGCYAGPMFNTVVGLGFSLVLSAWSEVYEVPHDRSLYVMAGFLVAGLLWALVVLTGNRMRLGRGLGTGLLGIYGCFLSVRLTGVLDFADHSQNKL